MQSDARHVIAFFPQPTSQDWFVSGFHLNGEYLGGTAAVVLLAPIAFAPLHLFPETPAMTLGAAGFLGRLQQLL